MNPHFELALKRCDRPQLENLLVTVGARLGTPAERPDDMDRARAIAHQLNNILTGIRLSAGLDKFP